MYGRTSWETRSGQPSRAFSALRGLWVVHEIRGELQAAQELGERLLSMRSSLPDPASLIEVHRACGNTLLIARRQAARSLELRAAMSLGRLWQAQDRTDEARRLVAEVDEWFAPGLATPDLRQARRLLERWADT